MKIKNLIALAGLFLCTVIPSVGQSQFSGGAGTIFSFSGGGTVITPVQGETIVGGAIGTANSSAQLDTSVFTGTDICLKTNAAYTAIGARGGTLDSRGYGATNACTTNPFSSTGANSFRVVRVMLCACQIFTSVPWVTPQKGIVIEGTNVPVAPSIAQAGTSLIACDAAGPEGCGGFGTPTFPGTGYTMQWNYPHPPFPSLPPIQITSITGCTRWPRYHFATTAVSAGALTGTLTGGQIVQDIAGLGCTAVTGTVGYGGIGSGGTLTFTCVATCGTPSEVTVTAGGSGYSSTQGTYTALIMLGGGSTGGVCTQVPLDGGCDGTGNTGGWLTDGFNAQLWFLQLSTNEHQRTFGVYSKNEQEGSGWWHGNCIDLDDNSACTFWDNADIVDNGSHGTHYQIWDVNSNNGSHASPNEWGHVYQAASVFVNITQGSCAAQPFVAVYQSDASALVAKVTYNGTMRGTLNGGCNTTPPTCYVVTGPGVVGNTGNNSPCTVVIGSNVVNGVTQTNVVTGITGLTIGNGHYPNASHSGPFHIGEATMNCHGSSTRCGGGVLISGVDSAVYDIHCEYQVLRGAGNATGVLGFLGTQTSGALQSIGSCVRFGTGNEVTRAGIAFGVDEANTAAALIYVSNGVDNTQSVSSLSMSGDGYAVIDDNNETAGSSKNGCDTACVTGVQLGSFFTGQVADFQGWTRADGYDPGGFLNPGGITIGGAQDLTLTRVLNPNSSLIIAGTTAESGTTVTFTTGAGNFGAQFAIGQLVTVTGCNVKGYNVAAPILSGGSGTNTLTYTDIYNPGLGAGTGCSAQVVTGILAVGQASGGDSSASVAANRYLISCKATATLTAGQGVKWDAANDSSCIVITTAPSANDPSLGLIEVGASAGGNALVAVQGIVTTAVVGTGTCTRGQLVHPDTTTAGRVKCDGTFVAGTQLGKAASGNAVTVGNPFSVAVQVN